MVDCVEHGLTESRQSSCVLGSQARAEGINPQDWMIQCLARHLHFGHDHLIMVEVPAPHIRSGSKEAIPAVFKEVPERHCIAPKGDARHTAVTASCRPCLVVMSAVSVVVGGS